MKLTPALSPDTLRAFETVPDLYLILSPDLVILTASEAYLHTTLTERSQIQGKYVFDVFPDNPALPEVDGVANLSESLRQVLRFRKPHQMDLQRYDIARPAHLGGGFEEKYWSIVNTPVLDPQGQVRYIINKVADVTAQVKSQRQVNELQEQAETLRQRERFAEVQRQRLQEVFWQAPVGIAIFSGPAMFIELANASVAALWGRDPGMILQKPLLEALPDAREQGFERVLQHVRESGAPFIGREIPVTIERNGKPALTYFNCIIQPLPRETGKETALIYVATDVTAQVLARQAIEENARQMQVLLESLPHIAWTANAEGLNTYLNAKWYEYTGSPADDTEFRLLDYLHPDDVAHTLQQWKESIRQGVLFEVEYRFRRADGEYRWMLGRALPLKNEQGEIIRWIGTCTDIQEMKLHEQTLQRLMQELAASNEELAAANEEIRSSNEELGETNAHLMRINTDLDNFIYTASHDLKSPISNIEGLMQVMNSILRKKGWQDDTFREVIAMMTSSINRFKATIADLTDIAKVEKQMREEPEQVSLAAVVHDVGLDLQESIAESGAHILSRIPERICIQFSRKNLKSIVYNLLSNAIKYRSPDRKPEIVLDCREEERYWVLSVQDNGLGIRQTDLTKIFGMFIRLHSHVEGTGVGLYIVKKMVENAGGRIELRSEVDAGSTFWVYFRKP